MEQKLEQLTFNIEGMHCANCALAIEESLKNTDGITQAGISLATNSGIVSYDPTKITPRNIFQAVKETGYTPKEIADQSDPTKSVRQELGLMILSIVLALPFIPMMFGIHFMPMNTIFFVIIATITQFTVGLSFYRGAYYSLKTGVANMDVLVALGTTAGYVYSMVSAFILPTKSLEIGTATFWETAPMLIMFIRIGKYLETRARGQASSVLQKLLTLQTDKARLVTAISDDTGHSLEKEVSASTLVVGDIVSVKPGERIPVDGVIIDGTSFVDESLITGESIPVKKIVDTAVYSGTINKTGVLKIKVTKPGQETVLAQIVRLVKQAQLEKPPIQKLVDRIASYFVPIVVGIALLTLVAWLFLGNDLLFSLSRSIAVIMIACPCAMGLATPMAIIVGTSRGLTQGILFKKISVIEIITKINMVIFDKTGTLTEGKPVVTEVVLNSAMPDFLASAAGLAINSNHPFSEAIIEKANSEQITFVPVTDTEERSGEGIVTRDGQWILGSTELLIQSGIDISPSKKQIKQLTSEGKSIVCLVKDNQLLGVIALADKLRTTANDTVKKLQSSGIKVVLLSGDKKAVAESIGKQLAVDETISEVLPTEKIRIIKKYQDTGYKVAMVGDGINDAPALAQADLGIAIASGTDIAKESGDIVLLHNDPMDIVKSLQFGRATLRKIKQNLFWAFIYNIVGIPLAAGVFYPVLGWVLKPEFAGLAMALSSISVVINSWLLMRYRLSPSESKIS